MQFAPRRYPQDFDFRVMATLGIVAREVEAMQLTQLMGMLPDQYPQVSAAVAKGIIDLGALHNKADIMEAIDAATAPPPPEAQKRQKDLEDMQFLAVSAEAEGKVLDNRVKIATVKKLLADAQKSMADSGTDQNEMMVELARLKVELEELDVARETNRFELLKAQLAFRTAQEQAKKPAATSSK
jgi:hypothetical protein